MPPSDPVFRKFPRAGWRVPSSAVPVGLLSGGLITTLIADNAAPVILTVAMFVSWLWGWWERCQAPVMVFSSEEVPG